MPEPNYVVTAGPVSAVVVTAAVTGRDGPNLVSPATATTLPAGSLMASDGTRVVPVDPATITPNLTGYVVTGDTRLSDARTPLPHTHAYADLTGLPNLSVYATTAALTTGLAGKADTAHAHAFSAITSTPTTVAGYGITDAARTDAPNVFAAPQTVDTKIAVRNPADGGEKVTLGLYSVTGESGETIPVGKIEIAAPGTPIQIRPWGHRGAEFVPGGAFNELAMRGLIRSDTGLMLSTTGAGASFRTGTDGVTSVAGLFGGPDYMAATNSQLVLRNSLSVAGAQEWAVSVQDQFAKVDVARHTARGVFDLLPHRFREDAVAVLPSAVTYRGVVSVSDRGYRLAYSDGSVWRWVSDDTTVS